MPPHIYISDQWIWNDTDPKEGSFWEMPRADIGLGLLDLRSLPQCGTPGPTPQGLGLFVLSEQDNTVGRYLGDSLGKSVTAPQRQGLATLLGLGEQIVSTNVLGVILELFGPHADPSGQTRWKPLRGSARRGYELHLAGQHLKWRYDEFDEAYRRQGLEVDHLDWVALKTANLLSGSGHYRRVLTGLAEKYRITPDALLQKWGESWVQALPHSTVITESFNKADSDTLGPDLSWTEVRGDIDVVGNRAKIITLGNARADSDLSSDDHYSQIDVIVHAISAMAVAMRFDSGAETFYYFRVKNAASATFRNYKRITGTDTMLDNVNVAPPTVTYTPKGEVSDSALEGFIDDVSKITSTDSAITGNTRCGIWGDVNIELDDFEAGDLAVGGRTMGALAGHGGLAGVGGIAGRRGGIAG